MSSGNTSGSASILIVDDEEMVASVVSLMLEELGHQPFVCNSSGEALTLFQNDSEKFDLVLTDLSMPEMNGAELAAELKALKPTLPVLVMTGFGGDTARADSEHSASVDAFLSKPLMLEDLATALQKALPAACH